MNEEDNSVDEAHHRTATVTEEAGSSTTASVSTTAIPTTWRDNGSKQKVEEHRRKYNLQALPKKDGDNNNSNVVYTSEERSLLQMYDTVKTFEREVIRLKEKKARERIYASTAIAPAGSAVKKKKKKKKRNKLNIGDSVATAEMGVDIDDTIMSSSEEEDGDDNDDNTDGSDDDDNVNEMATANREDEKKRLQELKDKEAEERMREELLGTNKDDDDDGLDGFSQRVIKKRKFTDDNDNDNFDGLSPTRGGGTAPSLLSKMMVTKTPPHEFSDKDGFKPWKGTVLFPDDDNEKIDNEIPQWTPKLNHRPKNPNDGAFVVPLEGFDISKAVNGNGPNTLAIKFSASIESRRFSFNIAGPNDKNKDFNSVLFHFNPRPRERGGQIVVNDKQDGIWGRAVNIPLTEAPVMFGQPSATIIVQINGDGFDVFVENKHVARLEHRVELPSRPCSLILQFPTCDDSRRPENWIVYKAWWGNRERLCKDDVSNIAGVNAFDSVHPTKLFINGLRKIRTDEQVELRTAEIERAFGRYGGPRGVQTIVPKRSRYAFVEFETEQQCDLALQKLEGNFPYQLNRARRTKHEALEMERQDKETGGGKSGW